MAFDFMAILNGEWFYSPFIIPVAGCAMILGIVASGAWARVRSLEIKSQERLARIAHGLPVEPDWDQATVRAATEQIAGPTAPGAPKQPGRPNDGSGARRAGVVLTAIGAGLFLFFAILAATLEIRAVFTGALAGVLPLAIGIGFLVDAKFKKEEFERRFAAGWHATPNLGPGAGLTPPPPPPSGMTPAQASDWRPSSSTLK